MKLIITSFVALALMFSPKVRMYNDPECSSKNLRVEVKNADDSEGIGHAEVAFYKEEKLIAQHKTNSQGKIDITLPAANYEVVTRAVGFETQRLRGFNLAKHSDNSLVIFLQPSILEEVVVKFYHQRSNENSEKFAERWVRLKHSDDASKVSIRALRAEKIELSMRLPQASIETGVTPQQIQDEKDAAASTQIAYAPTEGITPRAGLLTAGEWNDLHNWNNHWLDLLADGEINPYQKMYGFFPRHRFTVYLENENHFPAIDVPIRLMTGQQIIWEARTDNTGKAELWAAMFDEQGSRPPALHIETEIEGKKITLGTAQAYQRFILPFECSSPKNVDIVWAVDATGSMGDELEFLKTELLDVIQQVSHTHPDLAFRMGTVFYRDRDDDYLTKSSLLNFDIEKTVQFIKKQSAAGGGDYPEAVDAALDEVVQRQPWSAHAVARICFLVLDASPHQNPESNATLQKSIALAARKGIRIVPVVASGIQKDTEFLMKFFGLATNGTYVFLTDHSGIGHKHLEPTADTYNVEALNRLLVRLITEFTAVKSCTGKSVVRFDDPQQPVSWEIHYFPNPASDQFLLELPVFVHSVSLFNSEGKMVRKLENLPAGKVSVSVADLPEGIYTLRIWKDNEWRSGKIVVVRS